MRIAAATLLAALLAVAFATTDARAVGPTLRIVPGPPLAVAGAGFVPRTLVRVRLKGQGGLSRLVVVRSGARGTFFVRFASLESCSLIFVKATGTGNRQAQVPTAWFVRDCPPPPPPLDP